MSAIRTGSRVVAVALSVGILAAPWAGSGVALAENRQCQQETATVTLAPADSTAYHVAGWLCWQGGLDGKTVQLLMHGLTYDHTYFDWPLRPYRYSYVQRAVDAGYATFNIDRLGDGLSDHPANPDSLTTESEAYVAHQLVQQLRAGELGGHAFGKVIATGHSYGSIVELYEAATYADVDGLIVTGSMHDVSAQVYTVVAASMYPAAFDPKFAGSGLALGYLTTQPGTRGADFYNTDYADPAVVSLDEALKQTATSGELATINDAEPLTPQIQVPVMLAMGEKDILFCDNTLSCADSNAVMARESSHYSAQACLETLVSPQSGHDTNLHPNAPRWFEAAMDWANRRVGTEGRAPTQLCQ